MKDITNIKNELIFLNSRYSDLLNLKLKIKSLSLTKNIINSLNKIACKIVFLNKKLVLINFQNINLIHKKYTKKFRGESPIEEYLLTKWCDYKDAKDALINMNMEICRIKVQKKRGNYNVVFKKLKNLVKKFM